MTPTAYYFGIRLVCRSHLTKSTMRHQLRIKKRRRKKSRKFKKCKPSAFFSRTCSLLSMENHTVARIFYSMCIASVHRSHTIRNNICLMSWIYYVLRDDGVFHSLSLFPFDKIKILPRSFSFNIFSCIAFVCVVCVAVDDDDDNASQWSDSDWSSFLVNFRHYSLCVFAREQCTFC